MRMVTDWSTRGCNKESHWVSQGQDIDIDKGLPGVEQELFMRRTSIFDSFSYYPGAKNRVDQKIPAMRVDDSATGSLLSSVPT